MSCTETIENPTVTPIMAQVEEKPPPIASPHYSSLCTWYQLWHVTDRLALRGLAAAKS
jgi:hypothetical protein